MKSFKQFLETNYPPTGNLDPKHGLHRTDKRSNEFEDITDEIKKKIKKKNKELGNKIITSF